MAAPSRIREVFEDGVLGSPFLCFANLAEAHRDPKVDLRGFGFEAFLDYMTRPAVEVYSDVDTANPLSDTSYRDACRRFVATYQRIAIGRANQLRLELVIRRLEGDGSVAVQLYDRSLPSRKEPARGTCDAATTVATTGKD